MTKEEIIYLNKIIKFVSGIENRLAETRSKHPEHRTCVQQTLQIVKRTQRYVASIEPKAMMKRYGRYLEAVKQWRSLIDMVRQCEMNLAVIGRKV